MFIGHFAIAFLLASSFPQVPVLVPLVAVSFPDLIWPFLVLAGIEKVKINPDSPLQKYIIFEKYPYSHSLILTSFLASAIGLSCLGVCLGKSSSGTGICLGVRLPLAPGCVRSSTGFACTWIRQNGQESWLGIVEKWAVGIHLGIYLLCSNNYCHLTRLPGARWSLLGGIFHLVNANTFFGFTKKNPFKTPATYALITLIGFALFIFFASRI